MRISLRQISRKAKCSPTMVTYVARATGIKFGPDSMLEEDIAIKLADALVARQEPKMKETLKRAIVNPQS